MDKVRDFGDPSGTNWAPFIMVGGGFGVGALVLAIGMFLNVVAP